MKSKIKVTARKWNGDDEYSWAIFRSDQIEPVVAGLHKREVPGHKKTIIELIKERNNDEST